MKVLVSGASGLIGEALATALRSADDEVRRLVRPPDVPGEGDVAWDPRAGSIDAARLEGFDAVVHLAGENIASGRWTPAKKERIRHSRVMGTAFLARALAERARPPGVLACASAVGFYGDRGDETLDETSPPGKGFLPEVCQAWEEAATPAAHRGIRVVHLRFGVVLGARGGALKKMLPPFKMGVGGKVGSGRQWMSWIALDDVVAAIRHALAAAPLAGPVNVTAPESVTNAGFTKALGRVLKRPTVVPLPAFAARLAFGELADALLLASARVLPRRLRETGFPWRFGDLEAALRHVLA